MADTQSTAVTLEALHQAIIDAIKAKFPDFATVEFYREDRKGVPLPACLLELTEWENAPDSDPGDGLMAVDARFEAHIILGFRTPQVKLEIRKRAAAMTSWLRLRRWAGQATGPANVIGAFKDDFSPELDQYECWRVEWSQELTIGEMDTCTAVTPTKVFIGFVPEVGVPHVDDYHQVAP